MNKKDLHEAVMASAPEEFNSQAHAGRAVDATLDIIKRALVDGEKITLNGFGSFEVKGSPARKGRNPQTGQPMEIAAKKRVHFKSSTVLKEALNS